MQKIIAFFLSILAFFSSLFALQRPAADPPTDPVQPVVIEEPKRSKFWRDVDWGSPVSTYYKGMQDAYNSPAAEIPFSYVRGYPNQPGDVSLGGTFILDEEDGGECVVFEAVAGRNYTVTTAASSFYPGSHAKYGQVDTMEVAAGTPWYNAVDLKKAWNGKTSVTVTPEFSGICFVYLCNESRDALIGNVHVTETGAAFNKFLSAAQMNALYDSLLTADPDYITKTDLGVCSDGVQHLYEYDFTPKGTRNPKILIISGQHGYEKGGAFGVYFFFKDLCENYMKSETLSYLRSRIAFKIIPVVNPYGWDRYSYYNYNGVNLNRNYDNAGFKPNATGTDTGGAAPFDQPESAIVKAFVERNSDAVLFIDNHTNTGEIAKDMTKVHWIDTTPKQDDYYNNLFAVCDTHFARAKEHFNADYHLGLSSSDAFGTFTNGNSQYNENFPSADAWATTKKSVVSMTFEGFNGFPHENVMYSDDCIKANAELFGNFLAEFADVFAGASTAFAF